MELKTSKRVGTKTVLPFFFGWIDEVAYPDYLSLLAIDKYMLFIFSLIFIVLYFTNQKLQCFILKDFLSLYFSIIIALIIEVNYSFFLYVLY